MQIEKMNFFSSAVIYFICAKDSKQIRCWHPLKPLLASRHAYESLVAKVWVWERFSDASSGHSHRSAVWDDLESG
jgi:hypothetical protein